MLSVLFRADFVFISVSLSVELVKQQLCYILTFEETSCLDISSGNIWSDFKQPEYDKALSLTRISVADYRVRKMRSSLFNSAGNGAIASMV